MSELTLGELFAGVMGFSQGFERAGFKTIWAVEKDAQCLSVIRRHQPELELVDDVNNDAVFGLRTPTIVTFFGSPCQGLSAAGERKGLADSRSNLFYRGIDIIEALQPEFACWENVPGALNIFGGDDFRAVVRSFTDIGYSVAWRVYDAQYFGPPQRRRRILLLATRNPGGRAGAERCSEILSLTASLSGDFKEGFTPWADFTDCLTRGIGGSGGADHGRYNGVPSQTTALTQGLGSGGADASHAQAGWMLPEVTDIDEMVFAPNVPATEGTLGANKAGGFPIDLDRTTFIPEIASTLGAPHHGAPLNFEHTTFIPEQVIPFHPQQVTRPGSSVTGPGDVALALTSSRGGGAAPAIAYLEGPDVAMCLNSSNERLDGPVETFIIHSQNSGAMQGNGNAQAAFAAEVTRCLDTTGGFSTNQGGTVVLASHEIANTLTASLGHHGHSSPRGDGSDKIVTAITDPYYFETRVARNGRGAPSPLVSALKAQSGRTGKGDGAPCVVAKRRVRRLTPTECERLMGFSDGHTQFGVNEAGKTIEISDSARYSMCGNSVSVAVTAWLGHCLASSLK